MTQPTVAAATAAQLAASIKEVGTRVEDTVKAQVADLKKQMSIMQADVKAATELASSATKTSHAELALQLSTIIERLSIIEATVAGSKKSIQRKPAASADAGADPVPPPMTKMPNRALYFRYCYKTDQTFRDKYSPIEAAELIEKEVATKKTDEQKVTARSNMYYTYIKEKRKDLVADYEARYKAASASIGTTQLTADTEGDEAI